MSQQPNGRHLFQAGHPRRLIPELCRQFYDQGWFSGTGGGISLRQGNMLYVAPSAVQKERLEPEDLFVLKMDGSISQSPPMDRKLTLSQCTPLFMNAYHERHAGAVLHSHGIEIVMASLIYGREFKLRNLEMLKGIYHPVHKRMYRYDEELVVPIIENTCFESDLKDSMLDAMRRYPQTNAVIVRRHGIYVWGDSWQQCKTMAECYHYLAKIAVEMEKLGINEYTHDNEASMANTSVVKTESSAPVAVTPAAPSSSTKATPKSAPAAATTPKATPKAVTKATPTSTATSTPKTTPGGAKAAKATPNSTSQQNGKPGGKVKAGRVTKKTAVNKRNSLNKSGGPPPGWNGPPPMGPGGPGMMGPGPGPMGPMPPGMMGPGMMGPGMMGPGPMGPAMMGPGPMGPSPGRGRGGKGGNVNKPGRGGKKAGAAAGRGRKVRNLAKNY